MQRHTRVAMVVHVSTRVVAPDTRQGSTECATRGRRAARQQLQATMDQDRKIERALRCAEQHAVDGENRFLPVLQMAVT